LAIQPLTDSERLELLARVAALELEHGDLDEVIDRLGPPQDRDELLLRRLKKKKLLLKDRIEKLRARLVPDIVA